MSNMTQEEARKQLQGQRSRAMGKQFEDRISASFAYYKAKGFADVEKTPEPIKVLSKPDKYQRFTACFTSSAQPDYKGTMKGGRAVMFEAKFTWGAEQRLHQDAVTRGKNGRDGQWEYLDRQEALGARCYILAGFLSGNVYRIPWADWKNMKAIYGRKYVTEENLGKYLVGASWNNTLLLLG